MYFEEKKSMASHYKKKIEKKNYSCKSQRIQIYKDKIKKKSINKKKALTNPSEVNKTHERNHVNEIT